MYYSFSVSEKFQTEITFYIKIRAGSLGFSEMSQIARLKEVCCGNHYFFFTLFRCFLCGLSAYLAHTKSKVIQIMNVLTHQFTRTRSKTK